jgi:hypothetical protein
MVLRVKSDIAERVGFEPTIPLPVYHLSRVASSTAPAPLQVVADGEKYSKKPREMQFDNRMNRCIFPTAQDMISNTLVWTFRPRDPIASAAPALSFDSVILESAACYPPYAPTTIQAG